MIRPLRKRLSDEAVDLMAEIAGLQRPTGGVGEGLGTGLLNDVDYSAIELRVLAFLQQEAWRDGA